MRYDSDRKVYVDAKGRITPIEKWYQWDLNRMKRLVQLAADAAKESDPFLFKVWSSWVILAAVCFVLWWIGGNA
jgi:hypothetical protein